MLHPSTESLAAEIAAHLKDRFDLHVSEASPIAMGWLNVKWKMATNQGPVFVKYYHPERYKLHSRPDRRMAIEKTLHLQHGLNKARIPCPGVHLYEGQPIQATPSGFLYTLMDWMDGHNAQAGSLNTAQMYELGLATGRMHKWLQLQVPPDKPAWKPDKEAYLLEWQVHWDEARRSDDQVVLEWLNRSRKIVETMDFHQFESSRIGWLHWDLWVDNLLVHEQGLAGIVDFDRMMTAYPEIDVARAILSGALQDGQLRMETVQAFMSGYREHSEAPKGILSRAMSMLYLIESIWWYRTEVRAESGLRPLLGRFIEEMHWLEDHFPTEQWKGIT